MTTKILAVVVLLWAGPLWAQAPEWRSTDLGQRLRLIAALREPTPPPAEFAQLIGNGLADPEFDSREGALLAIASRSGVLQPPTPENFAMWHTYRDVVMPFRKQVEALMYDQNEWMRHSAGVAYAGLNMRPAEDRWVIDLDEPAITALVNAFHQEQLPSNRAEIAKLFWLCKCQKEVVEAQKQFFRTAIYDSDAGVVDYAIRGAAELKLPDMLDAVVTMLTHENDAVRMNAATALGMFGRDAARYAGEIQAALDKENNAEIRDILKGSLQAVSE